MTSKLFYKKENRCLAGKYLWKIMTKGLTMKIVFLSLYLSMSFKEQLLAENHR